MVKLNSSLSLFKCRRQITSFASFGTSLSALLVESGLVGHLDGRPELMTYMSSKVKGTPPQSVKVDLRKYEIGSQEKSIQTFHIDAQGFRKTKNENLPS